jgi:hypothetical protein
MCVGGFYKIVISVFTPSIMPSVNFLKPLFISFFEHIGAPVFSLFLILLRLKNYTHSPRILHLAQVYLNFLYLFHFLSHKIFENIKLLQPTSMDGIIQYNKGYLIAQEYPQK